MPSFRGCAVSRPDHSAVQTAFHAGLWQPEAPEGFDARRFAVYRNNVQQGLSKALAARFPVVERLVGAPFFAAMARVFAAQHPPKGPVLAEWGEGFAAFLAGFPPVAKLPYLPDVARLEWLRGLAFNAADAPVADPAGLAQIAPERLILRLAPCVLAFDARFPAVSLWQANQPGAAARPLPPGPEFALVARTPDFALITEPLSPPMHRVLRALLAGQPFALAACEDDPTPLLVLLLRHGLIAQIGETPC